MRLYTLRGAVSYVTERTIRFSLLSCPLDKRATNTGQEIVVQLCQLPPGARRSITFDRGTEFRDHMAMKDKLIVDVWYCDPHSPWQRGMIENTNGILRRDMPRKTDINDYTQKDIEMIQFMLNSTPRKCLGYETPEEAFIQKLNGGNCSPPCQLHRYEHRISSQACANGS
jgi:IS30 family transposase